MPQYSVKGFIPAGYQAKPGKALCVWGDAGWGGLVRQGKYHDGKKFADDLVGACVKMVHEWNPQPKPTWVTCVPSLRHPDLVPNFAKRLAAALGLPFHMVIAKTDDRPEQNNDGKPHTAGAQHRRLAGTERSAGPAWAGDPGR